jgi:hypothetical protein
VVWRISSLGYDMPGSSGQILAPWHCRIECIVSAFPQLPQQGAHALPPFLFRWQKLTDCLVVLSPLVTPRYRRKSTRVAPRRHRNLGHRGHNPPFHLCATWNRDFAYYWWARARDGGKYRSAWCALGPACCRHNSPVSRWISASCQRSPVLETTVNASPIMCPPSSAWPTVPYASGQQCH